MRHTKIDWCDATWNPVTGCLHGCEYCYARGIAERFGGCVEVEQELPAPLAELVTISPAVALDKPLHQADGRAAAYPLGFKPTLHRYRLDQPKKWPEPLTIFVCSMADLFGEWMPDDYIMEVFRACEAAPHHRYLFLTKNPARYVSLAEAGLLPNKENFYYGVSADTKARACAAYCETFSLNRNQLFASVEPILEDPGDTVSALLCDRFPWVIVGAESGTRKDKVIPEREWIDRLAGMCGSLNSKIFMKESLRELMGSDFRQEFPWEVRHD